MGRCLQEPDEVDIQIGRRIQQRRQEFGISQAGLAAKLGLSLRQIARYEDGSARPRPTHFAAIADLLNAPLAYFFLGEALGPVKKAAGHARPLRCVRGNGRPPVIATAKHAAGGLADSEIQWLGAAERAGLCAGGERHR